MNKQNRPPPPPPIIVAPPIQVRPPPINVQSLRQSRRVSPGRGQQPQLIEKTSKKYKGWMLIGLFGIVGGGIDLGVAAMLSDSIPDDLLGLFVVCGLLAGVAGVITFFTAGLLAWWETG